MREPIFDPTYWKERLANCHGELHRAVFNGSIDQFSPINDRHRRILAALIRPDTSVLDAGCGYGRLLGLMPSHWAGEYLGVDLCPEFIYLARMIHGGRAFTVGDLRDLSWLGDVRYDIAVVASVRSMVVRNAGQAEWAKMRAELNRVAKNILYLDYGEWD